MMGQCPPAAQERRAIRAALLCEVVRVHRQLQAAAKGLVAPGQLKALQDWDTAYAQVSCRAPTVRWCAGFCILRAAAYTPTPTGCLLAPLMHARRAPRR